MNKIFLGLPLLFASSVGIIVACTEEPKEEEQTNTDTEDTAVDIQADGWVFDFSNVATNGSCPEGASQIESEELEAWLAFDGATGVTLSIDSEFVLQGERTSDGFVVSMEMAQTGSSEGSDDTGGATEAMSISVTFTATATSSTTLTGTMDYDLTEGQAIDCNITADFTAAYDASITYDDIMDDDWEDTGDWEDTAWEPSEEWEDTGE